MSRHVPSAALWITDDVLAEAWRRFARVSHTHTSQRHGCTVPGPLEARRRIARRRMGLAAATAGGGALGVDWGALFGLGARPPLQPEKSWSWEAPRQLSGVGVGVGPPPPPATVRPTVLKPKPPEEAVQEPSAVNEADDAGPLPSPVATASVVSAPSTPYVVIEASYGATQASKAASETLLRTHDSLKTVDVDVMQQCITFLQRSEGERQAENLRSLLQWLESRGIETAALNAFALCIHLDEIRLRNLGDELVAQTLTSWARPRKRA
ncbi:hypothetical protein LTR53_009786 [Teratosphaeriaceae sp. CCFEE 6253]|nr:hypothetical protein LTR53_009786 [Teratosphaeriaceae sp. CCFEE 6253]